MMLDDGHLEPLAQRRMGMSRSITVVFPVFDLPTNETNGMPLCAIVPQSWGCLEK